MDVERNLPSYKAVSSSLYREYAKKYPAIHNLLEVPQKLRTTIRGTMADEDDPEYNEEWLTVDNDIALFMSPKEVEVSISFLNKIFEKFKIFGDF